MAGVTKAWEEMSRDSLLGKAIWNIRTKRPLGVIDAPPAVQGPRPMSSTVKSVAYVHTADIDPTVVKSGATWEGLANICVTAAEKALDTPPKDYTPTRRNSLTDIFASMNVTHRSIRLLVALGDEKPESVDALVLARLQLEGLYTMCLLTEKAEHVDRFVKEAWKRQYVRYLLMREETKGLDRFVEAQTDVYECSRLLKLATVWNVTEAERLTIEHDELEMPLPAGFVREPIRNFPTGGVITQFGFLAEPLARKPLILQMRRDVRVVEGARLEIESPRTCRRTPNPTNAVPINDFPQQRCASEWPRKSRCSTGVSGGM